MFIRSSLAALSACAALVLAAETANAATLWRGIIVVTSRTAIPACIKEYSFGDAFDIQYRPNLGALVPETVQVMGPNGALLVTSTDLADLTLRTGNVNISGTFYAKGFQFNSAANPITISPAAIASTTPTITMSGTLKNAGISGCDVKFRASLLPVADAAP